MAVGAINDAKELAVGHKPLLLAVITLTDSIGSPTKRRYASSGLNTADGSFVPTISGFPETGQSFLTRIKNTEIAATQALSEQGIDITPTVGLDLSDVDKAIWVDEKNIGHKGADMTLYFIFWNVGQNDFSTDWKLIFSGVCGPAQVTEKLLSVAAISRMNLGQKFLPAFHVQKRCGHIFPDTTLVNLTEATALHQLVADDPSHASYGCHYSALASGANARGNLNAGARYMSCNQTFPNCTERMGDASLVAPPYAPIEKDTSGRFTGTFSGVRWDQPTKFQSRGYAEKASIEGLNSVNEAKYNDYVPMGWGTFWVDPVILNVVGDANFTRFEALVGVGEYSSLRKVIVNDIEVDKWGTSSFQQNQQISLQMHWREWNTGSIFGRVNGDTIYDYTGDPYGSWKVISITIPRKLNPSNSIPRVRILADGPKTRKYQIITSITVSGGTATATLVGINRDIASNATFPFIIAGNSKADVNGSYTSLTNWTSGPPGTFQFPTGAANGSGTGGYIQYEQVNTNPAWIIMDALAWFDYKYGRIDLDSFMAAAAYFDENITYKDLYGATSSHARFKMSVGLRQRTVGSDLIRQMRTSCRSTLVPHPTTGALQLLPDRTLASQQPSAVAGSNYNTAVKSMNEAGTTTAGYVAYKFTYSSILKANAQGDSSFTFEQLPIQSVPNRVSFPFTDEENGFQVDSLSLVDAEDIRRSGQEVNGSIPIIGVMNFDQASRVSANWMAVNSRGNNRGDSGGTYLFSLETTYKCVHLRVGHIVMVEYAQYGLNAGLESPISTPVDGFLARVMAIKPSANFERVKLMLRYHVDAHYVDTYGQEDAPRYSGLRRDRLSRPALPWLPYEQQPEASSSLFPVTEWGFSIAADYSVGANLEPQAKLLARGKMPVNNLAPTSLSPPAVGSQGTTASTGGTITGDQKIWAQICVEDADGLSSAPSDSDTACEIDIPAGTNTNTAVIPVLQWDYPEGATYTLFAGNSRSKLSQQASGSVTSTTLPATISLTSLNEATWGMPDVEFDSAIMRGKVCVRAGVIGAEVLAVTSTTIQLSLFTDNPLTVNQFAPFLSKRYHVILMGMNHDYPVPIASWSISSNTGDTFTVVGPDCTAVVRGDGTLGLQAGDVVVITMRPVVGSDSDGNYVQDSNFVNALNPLLESHEVVDATNTTPIVMTTADAHGMTSGCKVFQKDILGNTAANGVFWIGYLTDTTYELYSDSGLTTPVAGVADWLSSGTAQRQLEGLTDDSDVGYELYCIKGTGAGNWHKIKKNTNNRIWIEGEWNVTPDMTSVFVVNNSSWNFNVPTETQNNSVISTPLTFALDIPNYLGQVVFLQGFTRDGGGNEPHRAHCPWRLMYVYGRTNPVVGNNDGYYEMETISGEVTPDLANGLSQQESATGDVLVNNPVNSAGAIVGGMRLYIKIVQDSTGYRKVTWGTEFVGFADGTEDPVQDPDTYSWYEFVRTNAGKWELRNSSKGRPIA